MNESVLFSLSKEKVDFYLDKASGDITFAETLIELDRMEYIMNTGGNDQDWVTVPLGRKKKPPPKKPPTLNPNITKNVTLDNDDVNMKHKKVNLSLSLAIQQARQKRSWSRKDLAGRLSECEKTIRDYENGTAIPNNTLIAKMEKILNIHLRGEKSGQEIKHIKIEM